MSVEQVALLLAFAATFALGYLVGFSRITNRVAEMRKELSDAYESRIRQIYSKGFCDGKKAERRKGQGDA